MHLKSFALLTAAVWLGATLAQITYLPINHWLSIWMISRMLG